MKLLTLKDVDLKRRYVLLRVDINSPYNEKKKKISDNERIKEHSRTIKYIASKKAKLVVLAHQGRKGDPDFTNLEQHAKFLSRHSGKKVHFVNDITGEKALSAIRHMSPGEVLLLDNVRGLDEETKKVSPEEHASSNFVKTLSPFFDYFVQDGFSVCHRSQASVVGFPMVIKSVAGLSLQKELSSLEKLSTVDSATYVLGGAKPEEDIMVLKFAVQNPRNTVITGGIFGMYCSAARGINLGKNMEKLDKKIIEDLKPLVSGSQVMVPQDYVMEGGGVISSLNLPADSLLLDIGPHTTKQYKEIIRKSKVIFGKGPMGKYEDRKYMKGTKEVLKAMARAKGFSLIGGGNTTDAIHKLKIPKSRFSHISLAGGALLEYIAGMELPGVEILKKWKK